MPQILKREKNSKDAQNENSTSGVPSVKSTVSTTLPPNSSTVSDAVKPNSTDPPQLDTETSALPNSGESTQSPSSSTAGNAANTAPVMDPVYSIDTFLVQTVQNPKDRYFLLRVDQEMEFFVSDKL